MRESDDGSDPELSKHLATSQQALRRLRWNIGIFWLSVALLTSVVLEVFYEFSYAARWADATWLGHLFLEAMFNMRLLLLGLAPLADDVAFSRVVIVLDVVTVLELRISDLRKHDFDAGLYANVYFVSYCLRGVVFTACCIWASAAREARRVQQRLWQSVALFIALTLCEKVVHTVAQLCDDLTFPPVFVGALPDVVLLYFALCPHLRETLQDRLWSVLKLRALCHGAASLACLIGTGEPSVIIARARARFKCARLDEISFELIENNGPLCLQSNVAEPCLLGDCDAFISHSWHDDALAKWHALQAWRASFVESHGREPRVWFDKCCIDQSNIDEDLRCLPVFLKGCQRMVVLCGPTFLSRLWCILELFTYIHMGGSYEDVEFVFVCREGHEDDDTRAVEHAFGTFDARHCQCACPCDKERILAIIETAYVSIPRFNRAVQAIMGDAFQPQIKLAKSMVSSSVHSLSDAV